MSFSPSSLLSSFLFFLNFFLRRKIIKKLLDKMRSLILYFYPIVSIPADIDVKIIKVLDSAEDIQRKY